MTSTATANMHARMARGRATMTPLTRSLQPWVKFARNDMRWRKERRFSAF